MRPRGWHLVEKHLRYIDPAGIASPASGSLVDFGLYFFHNAKELIARGSGPYFYLAKPENHLEARLWDDVFTFSENALGIPHGTIRATVLIETIPAAFEMDEILYELRDHCAGLNAGRWDYIFSIIKNFRGRGASFVLPDRSKITMTVPFMRAYTELLVQTCHKRGAHAIGGMSAFIPNRRNPDGDRARARAGRGRQAPGGGRWIRRHVGGASRPDRHGPRRVRRRARRPAQPGGPPAPRRARRGERPARPAHRRRGDGCRGAVERVVAVRYLESWLRGIGAAAIDDLMEDAATAEISRSQLWQWIHQGIVTRESTPITRELIEGLLDETLAGAERNPGDKFDEAAEVFRLVTLGDDYPTFLTIPAYARYLVDETASVATGPVRTLVGAAA